MNLAMQSKPIWSKADLFHPSYEKWRLSLPKWCFWNIFE
jgi:hypothetical protein